MPTLVNMIGFSLLWVTIIWGAYNQMEAMAISAMLIWLAVHFYFSRHRIADLRVVLSAAILGPIVDVVLIQHQLVQYVGYRPTPYMPPLWIMAMWVNFALLMNHSLHMMLRSHLWRAALLGAVSAPMAYGLGALLGAAKFSTPAWHALAILSAAWAVLLPMFIALSRSAQAQS